MFILKDRVRDTSVTTGTGDQTLSGTAPFSYQAFSAAYSVNDTFWYAIAHQTANEWEVGLGTYSAANTLTRTSVLASSNSGSAVNFSAGTKDIWVDCPAVFFSGTGIANNAATVTVADAGVDTTTWPMLATSQTGNLTPATDSGLTYNATTNALTASSFIGNLTGNADTATLASTVTTNANLTGPITSVGNATAIASQTGTGTKFVVDNTPTLITPEIGAATGISLSRTGGALTVQTITSGTLALTSAGALNATSAAASTWTHSGGAFAINSTSQNVTIATLTSGTLALTSAGAVNTTSAAASTWTHSGGAWALNSTSQSITISTLTSGAIVLTSAGALTITEGTVSTWELSDAATNTSTPFLTYRHNTSGSPVNGFGMSHEFDLQDSTTTNVVAARMNVTWADVTHATRRGQLAFSVFDTLGRTCLILSTSGSAATIGFLGATAVVAQTGDVGTALVTFGLMSGTPTFAAANISGTTLASNVVTASLATITSAGVLALSGTSCTLTSSTTTVTVNGKTGINLQKDGTTYLDVGVTTANVNAFAKSVSITGSTAPGSGTSIEIKHDGTTGTIHSYDRSGGAYKALGIYALSFDIGAGTGGSTVMSISSTGVAVTGTLSTTGNATIGDGTAATTTLTLANSGTDVVLSSSSAALALGAITLNVTGTRLVQSYHTNITSTNAVTVDSSRAVKHDIEPYSGDALAAIDGMDVVTFRHNKQLDPSGVLKLGIIAESVNEPLAVQMIGDEGGHLGLNMMGLLTMALKSIQQLSARVKELEAAK